MKKIVICALSAITACTMSVGAVTVNELDISWGEPRMFHVSGTADSGKSGEKISFQVLNPEKSLAEAEEGTNPAKDYFVRLYQTSTDENGEFTFDFDIENATDKSGEFTLRIKNTSEDGKAKEVTFNYYSSGKMTETTDKLKAFMGKEEKDETAIAEIAKLLAEEVKNVYFNDFPLYDTVVSGDALKDAAECLSYMEPTDSGKQMMENIRTAVAIASQKNNIVSSGTLFGEYAQDLNIAESSEYATYEKYSDTYKEITENFFESQNLNTFDKDDYKTAFKDAVVLTELKKSNGSGGVAETLRNYSAYFDMTKYDASKNQEGICDKIAEAFENNSVKTIDDVQKILDSDTSGGNNGGGSSSSSGGSSSSSSGGGSSSGGVSAGTTGYVSAQPNGITAVKPQVQITFTDIDGYDWAKTEIEYLAQRGVIAGYSNTVFAPEDNLTRAQACKILCKVFSIKEETAGNIFADIKDGEWYTGYVLGAYKSGIINGYSETLFGPDDYVTRQDFVVMLMRALNKYNTILPESETDETAFADESSISDYALESVNKFKNASVISGKENGEFDPLGNITRAEAAKIIYRVQSIFEGRE